MLNIPLDRAYTCISANKEKIAVCGKSGLSLITPKYEVIKVNNLETHKLSYSHSDLLGVCRGKILEVYDNQMVMWSVEKHSRRIQNISWSQAGLLASCSKDSKLFVWDLRSPNPAIVFNPTKGLGVYCLAWSRHSNEIIASGHETALKLWDSRLPKKSLCTIRSAHPGRIINLDWNYNGNNLLSSSLLSCVKTWKTSSTTLSVINSVQTHFQTVKTLYSPDSNKIVYTCEQNDDKIHFLGGEDLKNLSYFPIGNSIEDMDWHDKGLAVLCADRVLKIVNFDSKDTEDRGENTSEDLLEEGAIDFNLNSLTLQQKSNW